MQPPAPDVLEQAGARAAHHRARAAAVREGDRRARRRHDGRAHDPAHRAGEQAHARRVPQGARPRGHLLRASTARTSAARSPSSGCASARSTARVQVSDAEVDNYLATVAAQAGGETEYLLVAHPRARARAGDARPDRAAAARARRRRCTQVKVGEDFAQVAAAFSDAHDALQGGEPRLAHAGAPADGVRRAGAQA